MPLKERLVSPLSSIRKHPRVALSEMPPPLPDNLPYTDDEVFYMERYMLVQHRDNDEFKPIGDITATIEMVAEQLLSPKHRIPIVSEDVEADGVILKIRRAMRRGDPKLLEEAIEKYNKLIRTYRKS